MYASIPQSAGKALPRPKLVVGIVIDQMRWDYLYRYYDRYGEGGFRRFLSEGVSCENTMITHLPAYTGVGHATIYTGTTPAVHGIAANDFTIHSQRVLKETHLKLVLDMAGNRFEGIFFRRNEPLASHVKLAYRPEINEYLGRRSIQLVIEAVEG